MNAIDIETICRALNDKAEEDGFFNDTHERLDAGADDFVKGFCAAQGLISHLISPFRWSFDKGSHEIRSGVIEFDPDASAADMQFTWVDVSHAKITEPE